MENSKRIHELYALIAKQQWDKITDKDWQMLLELLSEKRDWEQMWQLAQTAPAGWSVRFLLRLKEVAWMPEKAAERASFTQLVRLAEECYQGDDDTPVGLLYCQTTLEEQRYNRIRCVAISPNGKLVASGSRENFVRLWRLPDGKALKKLEGHTGPISCLAISPNGQLLASGSKDRTVRLWSLPDGMLLHSLRGHTGPLSCLVISPDGQVLACGAEDGTIRLWSLPDGTMLPKPLGHTKEVTCLAISPDGQVLASGSQDHTVGLWRLPDGVALKMLKGHTKWVRCVVFSPNRQMLASGSNDHTVRLWSLSDGMLLHTLKKHTRPVTSLAISPDGQVLVSGSWDNTVQLWRLPDGTALQTLREHTDIVTCLVISPDGRLLASGSRDYSLRLWRLSDGAMMHSQKIPSYYVNGLAISSNGHVLASWSRDMMTVRLWELRRADLRYFCVGLTGWEDLRWVQDNLQKEKMSDVEKRWLKFILALMRWNLSVQAGNELKVVQKGSATVPDTEVIDLLTHACQEADAETALQACDYLVQRNHVEAINVFCTRWMNTQKTQQIQTLSQEDSRKHLRPFSWAFQSVKMVFQSLFCSFRKSFSSYHGLFKKCFRESSQIDSVDREPLAIQIFRALQAGQEIEVSGVQVVKILLQACEDPGPTLATHARRALTHLQDIESQEVLCQLVIEEDHPYAREAVLTAHYVPRDPHQRALLFFLTEQWDKYEQLDVDQHLLKAMYSVVAPEIQKRLAAGAQRAGRLEWVNVAAGGRQRTRLSKMTDEDWNVALAVLSKKHNWEEMWQLAQTAPVKWSVRLLLLLKEAKWLPEQKEEQVTFTTLVQLAAKCCKNETDILVGGLVHCHATLEVDTYSLKYITISPDGQVMISEQRLPSSTPTQYIVRLWSLPDGKTLKTLRHNDVLSTGTHKYYTSRAISPDGRILARGKFENYREYGREIPGAWELGITDREILSENSVYTIQLWSLPDGAPLQTLEGHNGEVTCLAFSPDGRLLASGAGGNNRYRTATATDTTVRVWRVSDGAVLNTLEGHTGGITCLAFSPDGRLLVSGAGMGNYGTADDTTVRVWRLSDGAALHTLEGHTHGTRGLAISPNGQVLACMGFDTIRLWSLSDGTALHTLKWPPGTIECLALSPNGQVLACGGTSGYPGDEDMQVIVRLWSLPDGTALKTLEGHISQVKCLAFSPDGRMLASGSWDKTVRLWHLPKGKALQTLEGHTKEVECLAISPDGRVLASGGNDGMIRLWTLWKITLKQLISEPTRLEHLQLVEDILKEEKVTETERKWLEFVLILMRWQRRFDIEVGEAPQSIPDGEFDVEIDT